MTRNEQREATYQRFLAIWANTTPIAWDNEKFDPPAAPWARVSLRHTGGGQQTLGRVGNRKFERTGRIFVQLFEPPGEGLERADTLLDKAVGVFENCELPGSDMILFDVIGREIGEVEEGRWWASTVEAGFRYTVTR